MAGFRSCRTWAQSCLHAASLTASTAFPTLLAVAPARSFVAYLSDIVVDGLAKAVVASLKQLHSQVGAVARAC